MKKAGILNSDISRVLSYMGHTDLICVGDCGLPIPDEVERIDLSLKFGVPGFMETLEVVVNDMKVEKIVLAEEIKTQNPKVLGEIEALFAGQEIEVEFMSHTELKALTRDCKAVIRTGEITPYANIILQAGCIFA
ncbi:MAG: D-ribose pyranase [Lachnospiraceae bacterium]|nr:D-ribose pyranase [Lachnospiraceae bacterium]